MNFKRLYPIIILAIAVVGLYLQYRSYQKLHGDCNCGGGPAPIE
ncbi:hypothetical protein [Flavilitoribacter nigricans]|nr:hypothetical protein [Flavilitoribacter nigricans]